MPHPRRRHNRRRNRRRTVNAEARVQQQAHVEETVQYTRDFIRTIEMELSELDERLWTLGVVVRTQ